MGCRVKAPDPPTACRRSRCLFLRAARLPPQTNGVGAAFQCFATDSNRAMMSPGSAGCSPSNARRLSTRWMLWAMFSHDPLTGVYRGKLIYMREIEKIIA